ncbi:MAG: hypothetical protein RLZ13_647, partial [Bacteroidota bacterium]
KLEKASGIPRAILQNQVLDLGENTRPFFSGTAFSGELLLTANAKKGEKIVGQAFRFRYSGSQFELLDSDYLGLAALELLDLSLLEFSSSSKEVVVFATGTRRSSTGIPMPILLRKEGTSWVDFFLSGLSLQLGDQLLFFSYQGKDELLVASSTGTLTRYEVDLAAKKAVRKAANFLGFQDNPANRNLSIAISQGERPNLYSVDQSGRIFRTTDFLNTAVREEVLIRIQNQDVPLRLGRSTWLASVKSTLGEEEDLILGTRGGGLIYLSAIPSEGDADAEFLVSSFPNPTSGSFQVVSSLSATARLVSSLGQVILQDVVVPARQAVRIDAGTLAPGLYFLQLVSADQRMLVRKILVN